MNKNITLQYKIKKNESTFRGDVLLIVGKTGIVCSIENHEYKFLSEATEALNSALPVLIQIAAKEFLQTIKGRNPQENEYEILDSLIEALEKLLT